MNDDDDDDECRGKFNVYLLTPFQTETSTTAPGMKYSLPLYHQHQQQATSLFGSTPTVSATATSETSYPSPQVMMIQLLWE